MNKAITCYFILATLIPWAPNGWADNWLCLNPDNPKSKITFRLTEDRDALVLETSYGTAEAWIVDYAGLFPPKTSIYSDNDLKKPRSKVVIASFKKRQLDGWVYSNLILDESTKELQIAYMLVGQTHHWVQGDGRGMMWGGVDGDLKEDVIVGADRMPDRIYRRSNRFYQCNNF